MPGELFDPAHADRLDAPDRATWLPPLVILSRIGVPVGARVAEIGAGTGYFTLPLAGMVGDQGMIYAVDVQPEMLKRLDAKLSRIDRLWPIALVHADAAATMLPDASCDLVFAAMMWHELPAAAALLDEARRLLAPGGRLAIVDWRPDVAQPPGPPLDHRLASARVAEELGASRWVVDVEEPVASYTWLIVSRPLPRLRLVKSPHTTASADRAEESKASG